MNKEKTLQEQGKLLEPKLDVVFHALFREDNKELLGALTSDILREEVKNGGNRSKMANKRWKDRKENNDR